jgi:hypothetical protein
VLGTEPGGGMDGGGLAGLFPGAGCAGCGIAPGVVPAALAGGGGGGGVCERMSPVIELPGLTESERVTTKMRRSFIDGISIQSFRRER